MSNLASQLRRTSRSSLPERIHSLSNPGDQVLERAALVGGQVSGEVREVCDPCLAGLAEALLLLGERRSVWFAGLAAASFFTLIHQGPIFAAITNIVRVDQRALAIAMILLGASFPRNAIGPTAVGLIDDALQPRLDDKAIRYSMLLIAVTPVLAGLCMAAAARNYEAYAARIADVQA